MLNKLVIATTVISLCLLILLLNVTAPTTIGPFGILAVFIFGYLSSLGVMTYFLYACSRIFSHLMSAFTVRKPMQPLSLRRAYYYSTVLAAVPILILGLQSVGPLSPYEVILVAVFASIWCLYITKRIR